MPPASQNIGGRQLFAVAFEEIDAFADRLQYAKLNAVVDEFHEVAGAGTTRVDVAAGHSQLPEDRLNDGNGVPIAPVHEAGTVQSAAGATGCAHIDEAQAGGLQACVASDGIAPVG